MSEGGRVRKLESVQVLRGIAACMVVVMHAWGVPLLQDQPDNPVRLGAAGVDLFFVISGFIMATISTGKLLASS
jgi:exopolysaccharide production protein ExoZ